MIISRKTLEDFMHLEHEINRINRKLNYYARNPLATIHGVVKSSMRSYPYAESHYVVGAPDIKSTEERMKKVQQLIVDLGEAKSKYEEMQFQIDLAIEDVGDIVVRQIIQMKYIDRLTDEEIGEELGYERSTISKKLDKYLDSQISHC